MKLYLRNRKKNDLMRAAIAAAYPDEIDALRYE